MTPTNEGQARAALIRRAEPEREQRERHDERERQAAADLERVRQRLTEQLRPILATWRTTREEPPMTQPEPAPPANLARTVEQMSAELGVRFTEPVPHDPDRDAETTRALAQMQNAAGIRIAKSTD